MRCVLAFLLIALVRAADVTCSHEVIMTISMDRDFTYEDFSSIMGYPNPNFLYNHRGMSDADILDYVVESLPFFEEEYGVVFSDLNSWSSEGGMWSDDGQFFLETVSISTAGGLPGPSIFRTTDSRLTRGQDECLLVLDGGLAVVALGDNPHWGGNFGAKHGGTIAAQRFDSALVGQYIFPGALRPDHDGEDLVLHYHSFAPMEGTRYGSVTLNCDVESVLGNGRVVGCFRAEDNGDGTLHMRDHQTIQLDQGAVFN